MSIKLSQQLIKQFSNDDFQNLRNYYLYFYKLKNPKLRVAFGKGKWECWQGQACNLREILTDEIIIEFDDTNFNGTFKEFQNLSWKATMLTGVNLYKGGITFEVWEHGGKSPHIHVHNLPIGYMPKDDLKLWKKCFIKHYVPPEFFDYVDFSLCGIHLIALEWANHWKGNYSIKKLCNIFNFKINKRYNNSIYLSTSPTLSTPNEEEKEILM